MLLIGVGTAPSHHAQSVKTTKTNAGPSTTSREQDMVNAGAAKFAEDVSVTLQHASCGLSIEVKDKVEESKFIHHLIIDPYSFLYYSSFILSYIIYNFYA